MADYDLHVHLKQGDDLAYLIDKETKAGDLTEPMRKWAKQLRAAAANLDKIADAMDDQSFSISADGNFITLHGDNARADEALKKLTRRRVGLRKAR